MLPSNPWINQMDVMPRLAQRAEGPPSRSEDLLCLYGQQSQQNGSLHRRNEKFRASPLVPRECEAGQFCQTLPLRSARVLRMFQHGSRCDLAGKGNQRVAPGKEERLGADAQSFVERFR